MAATVLVTKLTGQAWIRNTDGSLTALREGMRIATDANVVTASSSSVELQADGQPPLTIGEGQNVALTEDVFRPATPNEAAVTPPSPGTADALINAIIAGQDPLDQLDPTAAVLTGGGGGGGTFVRLNSILEATTPLGLAYPGIGRPESEAAILGSAVDQPQAAPEALTTVGQVNEAALPSGSSEGNQSNIVTGQVSLPAGWTVVPGSGNTPHGAYTIDAQGNFTFTLTVPTTDVSGVTEIDSFSYVITDGTTIVPGNRVDVTINDDVPTARDDIDTVTNATATGNVITGTDTTTGVAGADVRGADGASVTTVTSNNAPGNTPTVVGGVITIVGEYGTLVMQPDGSYVYTRTTTGPLQATETFTYTLTDGDQDTSTATLTLTIGDSGVTITGLTPQAGGGDVTVEEAALGDGSNPSSPDETGTGSFNISAPDGLNTVSIGGTVVISNGALVVSPTFTTALGNTFTVTGYDPANGVISYSYTLGDNEAHPAGAGNNDLFEDLAVVVTDIDGDSVGATLSVTIVDDVPTALPDTDTVDNSTATGNVITGAGTSSGTAGVDVQGADGASVTTVTSNNAPGNTPTVVGGVITIVGQYGTLVMQPDGSYVYTRATTGALQATETFTYTLTDGDQDTSTATLTLTIGDNGVTITDLTPQSGGGDVTVEEAALSDGSNPSSPNEVGTGSFTVAAPDGVNTVSIGGTVVIQNGALVANPTFTTALGNIFTVTGYDPATGVISYSYTLGDNEAHPAGAGNNDLFEDLSVVVTDLDGDSVGATLSVTLVDDVPTALSDIDTVDNSTATGNVITGTDTTSGAAGADVKGADGASVATVTSNNVPANIPTVVGGVITIVGQYGTLVMQPDGSYVYTLSAEGPLEATETFIYTLTDGDQDTSTATLTLTIGDSGVTINDLTPGASGGDVTVEEAALVDGSNSGSDAETGTGSFTIAAPDGVNTVSIGGTVVISNGALVVSPTFTTALGNTFTVTGYDSVTGVISYSYTLADNETHANGAGNNDLFEDLAVVVTDVDGDPANATLTVRIVDDVPTAANDTDTVNSATATANGNVITGTDTTSGAAGADVKGADGASVTTVTSNNMPGNTPSINAGVITIVGEHGTLVMQPDGSYVYTRASAGSLQATETFTYTLTDGDQDTSTATLTLTIGDSGVTINDLTPGASGGDVTVEEAALVDGSNSGSDAETGTGSFTIAAPDGVNTVSIGGTVVISNGALVVSPTFTTALGNTFTVTGYDPVTGVISYSYTLLDNETHPNAGGINNLFENLGVTVTDVDGDSANGTLSVKIVDDVPELGTFTPGTLPNAVGSVSGNFDLTPGADGIERFFINGPSLSGISYSQTVAPNGTTTLLAQTTTGTPVFSLVVKPDGTYDFNLLDPKPELPATQSLTALSSGGPKPFLETPDGLIEFTGSGNGVNASTQGFGVSNQWVDPGENFTMEFHTVGSIGDTPTSTDPQYVGKLDFTTDGSGTVSWTVTNTGTGQTESGTATVINGQLLIDPTIDFNLASITGTSGSMRLQAVSVGKIILPPDYGFEFSITAQDQDGDITSAQTLDISVTTQVTTTAGSLMAAFAMPMSTEPSGLTPEPVEFADQVGKEPAPTDEPVPSTSEESAPAEGQTETKPEDPATSDTQPEYSKTEHVSLLDDGELPVPAAPAHGSGSEADGHSNSSPGEALASPPLPEDILVSDDGDSIEGLLPPAVPATPPGAPTPQTGEPRNLPPMMPDHAPVPHDAEELARSMLEQGQHNNPSHL